MDKEQKKDPLKGRHPDGKWRKGYAPNPKGRPKGVGVIGEMRREIARDTPGIIRMLVKQAKGGDTSAAKLLLERVLPAIKAQAAPVQIPEMAGDVPLATKAAAALDAAAEGDVSPDTAAALVAAVGGLARIMEVDELEQRIAKLEAKR